MFSSICSWCPQSFWGLWPFTCFIISFVMLCTVHAVSLIKTQPGWPLHVGCFCGAGHGEILHQIAFGGNNSARWSAGCSSCVAVRPDCVHLHTKRIVSVHPSPLESIKNTATIKSNGGITTVVGFTWGKKYVCCCIVLVSWNHRELLFHSLSLFKKEMLVN